MKLMKVIHIVKNMAVQEYQHSDEYQSIEVRDMTMPRIRFASIAKGIHNVKNLI
jgi:hypothetical protein